MGAIEPALWKAHSFGMHGKGLQRKALEAEKHRMQEQRMSKSVRLPPIHARTDGLTRIFECTLIVVSLPHDAVKRKLVHPPTSLKDS